MAHFPLTLTSRPGLRLSLRISKCLGSNTNSSASFLSDRGSAGLSVCTSKRPIWTRKVSRHDHRILRHCWCGAPPRPVLPCEITTINTKSHNIAKKKKTSQWRSSYQADFDPIHHEFEDVFLKALLAGRRQGERCRRVWDRSGATLILWLITWIWCEKLLVWGVRNIQQVK